MKIYTDFVYQNAKHLTFNNIVEVDSVEELEEIAQYDIVFGKLNGTRNKSNWIESDVLYADIDNENNDPNTWMTIEQFIERYKKYEFYITTSKSHMKIKDGKDARPKFHVYFPIHKTITDKNGYERLLNKLTIFIKEADKSIKNCDRLFYGNKNTETYYNSGENILKDLIKFKTNNTYKKYVREALTFDKGNRNTNILRLGSRMRKAGIEQKYVEDYLDYFNSRLKTPLDDRELSIIYKQIDKYANIK
jgi:putative DNA primase/helicase